MFLCSTQFLLPGQGIWWHTVTGGYEFFDGSESSVTQDSGPNMEHFRDVKLHEVYYRKEEQWNRITETETDLATPYIKIYTKFCERGEFSDGTRSNTSEDGQNEQEIQRWS